MARTQYENILRYLCASVLPCTFLSMPDQESTEAHIGVFLRHIRQTLNLTLRDCASVTHVNFTYLGQVERGERNPSDSWLRSYMESVGEYVAHREMEAA